VKLDTFGVNSMCELFVPGLHGNNELLSFVEFELQPYNNFTNWSYNFEEKNNSTYSASVIKIEESIKRNCPEFDSVIKNTQCYFTKIYEDVDSASVHIFTRGDHQNVKLSDSQPSAMLGIFLAAAREIMRLDFKENWQSITATGTFKKPRQKPDGNLILKDIGEYDKKFKAFIKYAKETKCDPDKQHLFIYISNKNDWEKELVDKDNKYICIKSFSPEKDTLFDILNCVFDLKSYSLPEESFQEDYKEREKYFSKFEKIATDFGKEKYTESQDYRNKTFSDILENSKSIFIYGPRGSGKSDLAVQLARYLFWNRKIYAPIWIEVESIPVGDKNHMPAEIREKLSRLLSVEDEDDIFYVLKHKDKPFLIIIDDIKEEIVDDFLERMTKFYETKEGKIYIVFISTAKCSNEGLKNLELIQMPFETREIKEEPNISTDKYSGKGVKNIELISMPFETEQTKEEPDRSTLFAKLVSLISRKRKILIWSAILLLAILSFFMFRYKPDIISDSMQSTNFDINDSEKWESHSNSIELVEKKGEDGNITDIDGTSNIRPLSDGEARTIHANSTSLTVSGKRKNINNTSLYDEAIVSPSLLVHTQQQSNGDLSTVYVTETAESIKNVVVNRPEENISVLEDSKTTNSNLLFPCDGVTLGKTTVEELEQLGTRTLKINEDTNQPYNYYNVKDQNVWYDKKSGLADHYFISRTGVLPEKWTTLGMSFEHSYDKWLDFARANNFHVRPKIDPHKGIYRDRDTFIAQLWLFYTADGVSYKIVLDFNYSTGTTTEDNNTLYSIRVSVQ